MSVLTALGSKVLRRDTPATLRAVADKAVAVLLLEPAGVRNTGDVEDDRLTAEEIERI